MKLLYKILLIALIASFSSAKVLQAGRFEIYNTTNSQYSDLTEFSVCGLTSSALSTLQSSVGRNPFLTGTTWTNASKIYDSCSVSTQTVTTFAVRAASYSKIFKQLLSLGYKTQLSCIDEVLIRSWLNDGFGSSNSSNQIKIGPNLVRWVFHDAMDYNNLIDSSDNMVSAKQGVDMCSYSPKGNVITNGLSSSQSFTQSNSKYLQNWMETPDIAVLGSIVALESWHAGPQVNFKAGRKAGTCNSTNNLITAPDQESFTSDNNKLWFSSVLNMTTKEMVALIGAHSLGGMIGVTTGTPEAKTLCDSYPTVGYIDYGSYFDSTPKAFDNEYYKMLLQLHEAAQLPSCSQIQFWKNIGSLSQNCQAGNYQWCSQTNSLGKTIYQNLRNVSLDGQGKYRNILIFPSDYNLIASPDVYDVVSSFAQDQNEFFSTFSTAFEKVANTGYDENSELLKCMATDCYFDSTQSGFVCSTVHGDKLVFDVNTNSDCSTVGIEYNCQLVSAFGTNGQIQCDNVALKTCPLRSTSQSIENTYAQYLFLNQLQ